MFAYAELDRRIADLQTLISGENDFGEKHHWPTHDRAKRLEKLINKNRKSLVARQKDVRRIINGLKRAVVPCDLRNLLAHGHWWQLDQERQALTVRREKVHSSQTRYLRITVSKIDRAKEALHDVEVELYKASREIKRR